jgi:hypothetical protein
VSIRLSFEDGEWFVDGTPWEEGVLRDDTLEVRPESLPALCNALRLVPRSAVVAALDGFMASVCEVTGTIAESMSAAIINIMCWDDDTPEADA